MSARVLKGDLIHEGEGHTGAALYDGCTGAALPCHLFDDEEEAELFIDWCTNAHGEPCRLTAAELERAFAGFREFMRDAAREANEEIRAL